MIKKTIKPKTNLFINKTNKSRSMKVFLTLDRVWNLTSYNLNDDQAEILRSLRDLAAAAVGKPLTTDNEE